MRVLVDASTLISFGQIGELDLLTCLDGNMSIVEEVIGEVTTEPANTNLSDFLSNSDCEVVRERPPASTDRAKDVLNESTANGDVRIIGVVLRHTRSDDYGPVAVVSDDKRVRTVAEGLGATVTGTVGVIARAVEERDMSAEEGKELIRRVDSHGLHMTGELREKAYELVENAVENG